MPRHICAGQRVEVHWSVVGSASVVVTPPSAGLPDGPVDSTGSATIAPATTTDVALHVTRPLGKPTTRTQKIEVRISSDQPEVLVASLGDRDAGPGCADGKVWATVHARRFAPEVKVANVATHAGDNRIYDVQHAGRRDTVAPGLVSTGFATTPIAGDWLLTAPLAGGQTCATAPHNLVIDVFTQCVPGRNQ